ncbi:unnamed protein product [Diatraea saccharalis]|uniref:Calponin-homology (CH) domain-containing protein n=1 Tax=Diatraea saccharalis TaxID=40085 RepID=A0A9P0FXW2_9NEOP|nr:unnamed protein product [Diatraea saccharalis]
MYFEIENTPEHIRKSRRTETVIKKSPKEEHPRLILAPFSKPAKVVFEDVPIGTSCERTLEVFNPSKQVQQITLGRALPAGLILHLPEEWLVLEPETCYCLTLLWTPIQPLALRDTIRFVSENRGRYDVIVVLKTGFNVKGKGKHSKVSKISPGKIEKKSFKRSPVGVCKKKAETIYNSTKNQKIVKSFQTTQHILKPSNKDNISTNSNYSLNSQYNKCPFDSPASIDFNFDTSEIFSNMRQLKSEKYLQNTYDKCPNVTETQNVLKPCNKQSIDVSATDLFDNLTFTPLKTIPAKNDNLNKGPKIIISMNSDSDFDDSLNVKNSNKENETHSIISITSTQPPNKWVVVNHQTQIDKQYTEMCALQTKKIPNTSSPKELNSPNFSINTELSRISDLSFFPQRFSTERKGLPRLNNDTHDIDEANIKLSSDTYTKYSPNTPIDFQMYTVESKPPHYFTREQQPKMCRQALFKEYYQQREIRDRNQIQTNDLQNWQNDTKSLSRPNSPTPLQSIPEESTQNTDTQLHDKTDKMSTFTINRTFDRDYSERPSMSATSRQSWSKKSVRAEPELWKVPASLAKKPKPSLKALKPKPSLKARDSFGSRASSTFEVNNKSVNQNTSLSNHIGNVYSQSFTLDPFLSTTYFYDEEAVCKFEKEFKRWLNCILTPPADLESNVEQKVDVGKAWLENRNKEVPLAPTKEQVCSVYHNSHRLKSLRRAARALLMSPEISLVFLKLNAQIEKKLIAIRIDRNLHLDVGLQKIIMELLLSYNPLWLRIGLEAIYGIILPLKSNSDIEGITTFIIQRMFKNPFLKNKHSKSNVPNMLLPAYMEAIKKFTLKKFLMLVFFLDQAKQRKLIPHDPCLFCRNAVCKESRDILIRFTRELIAGIGDITKHLRPLGYIVCHKQSYLDEYKYAVNNIAIDLRDGVRLSKVMEIILMKNGLLHQLRTPAISRLQKIHNVQVALNALKEANFVIVGDITAHDIADGHREKTLSLLWQLIHVFRAPLFEKAAGVIQMWWKKKYQVIIEKRKVEEQLRERLSTSAIIIQRWWRRIQYDRLVEWQMQQVTKATIVIQKYIRRWLFRRHYLNMKKSVLKIEVWYKSMKMIEEAKKYLDELKTEHENLRQRSAIVIQSYVRRWLCMRRFRSTLKKVVLMQSLSRRFLVRKEFLLLKKYTILIQQKYRSKLLMKLEMNSLAEKKRSAIIIQKYWRMLKEYRNYKKYKQAVNIIQTQYRAFIKMRQDRIYYTVLKNSVVIVQSLYRRRKACKEYARQREIIVKLQRRIRARQLMKKERINFLKMKTAASIIQSRFRAYLRMKLIRNSYIMKRNATRTIQNYFRAYLCAKSHREYYINLRNSVLVIQKHYRNVILMRKQRAAFLMLRRAVLCIQRRYRARVLTIQCKLSYQKLRFATVAIQRRFIALLEMRKERSRFLKLKSACIGIQKKYRALLAGRRVREHFVLKKQAAIKIQNWFRSSFETKKVKQQYQQSKNACITIQRIYRAYFIGRKERQEYLRIRTSVLRIQTYYRCYIEMKIVRQQYLQLRTATVTIQRYYKSYIEMKKERSSYLKIKTSVCLIENYYKRYKETQRICQQYYRLRECTLFIQRRYRSKCLMRRDREQFIELRKAIIYIQNKFRALREMKKQKDFFEKLRQASIVIQRAVRAHMLMKQDRNRYLETLKACTLIQTYYRSYRAGKIQREKFLQVKQSCIVLQQRYRALLMMRKERKRYLELRKATLIIQQRFRAHRLMVQERTTYLKILKACIVIQNAYKSTLACRKQMLKYKEMKSAAICIQRYYRCLKETRTIRNRYLALKKTALFIQYKFRANKIAREARRNRAASKIQIWYRSNQKRIEYRNSFLCLRTSAIKIQSVFRMYTIRKRFIAIKHATLTIQRFYRLYKLTTTIRLQYINTVKAIIKLQAFIRSRIANKRFLRVRNAALTIQAAYRLKKHNDILKARRETAAICIQKNVRKYLVQSRYHQYRKRIIYVQKLWRYKLLTRLMRCEFLQKRNSIIKLQAIIRGYLIRKQVQLKRESLSKIKEAKKRYWAASKIQALFRGHKARMNVRGDRRVTELRRRWREGALNSNQESMKERNEEAMEVLRNISDIETVIRAFRSLELLTEVFPMMYHDNASSIVTRVYIYMSVTNRSISSIEVLKSAASVLVNLTRYRITGPKIYARDRIPPILKFMWRFSNSETHLFCILSTYIWLFSKYDDVKKVIYFSWVYVYLFFF